MGHIPIHPASLANLLLQLLILGVILTGFVFARRERYTVHQWIMSSGILLGALSFFGWMLLSLIDNFDIVTSEFSSPGVQVTLLHAGLGTLAGSAAIFNILNVKRKLPKSLRRNIRRTMRFTFVIWILTFTMGFAFYFYYFIL